MVAPMANDDRIYVIEPDDTDPGLIQQVVPLGDAIRPPAPPPAPRAPRAPHAATATASRGQPPAHPLRLLVGAYALGPLAPLAVGHPGRGRRGLVVSAWVIMGLATGVFAVAPRALGADDRAAVVQAAAAAVALVVGLTAWTVGLTLADRRCRAGSWSRPAGHRPAVAALLGLLAPGLGFYLGGRTARAIATLVAVVPGLAAGALLQRAPRWWSWRAGDAYRLISDRQLEAGLLGLVVLAALGVLVWLVSAIEAARLAAGSGALRRTEAANRAPAALLLALVAMAVFFRPANLAGELDRLTGRLEDAELRLAPLMTAEAAVCLAPGEPVYQCRLAEVQADLGHHAAAARIRSRLVARWAAVAALAKAPGSAGRAPTGVRNLGCHLP